ncbi:MAG: patatin-like phospholipase family protein [Candidatus Omnitrophica bacterium]|nr:patatin-like phospholipase family protein [Candidatus Omnitrophota bacterium]
MFDFLNNKKRRKVALVLGGGSARGLAHIGVLKILEREKIPIDSIVGTSMGAMIGAAYSVGVPISQMEERAYKFTMKKILDPTMPSMGLLAGVKLEATIKHLIDSKQFEDCKIPLAVVTNDIETGEEVVFQKGNLIKVVRASCSWPGIFNPVRIDGRLLSDGGIKHSVPTKIARDLGADYVIAVDVGFCVRRGKIDNIFQMIVQSFQIMGEELNQYQSRDADSVIKVYLTDIDQAAFDKSREIIAKGAEAAEAGIEQIKRDLRV